MHGLTNPHTEMISLFLLNLIPLIEEHTFSGKLQCSTVIYTNSCCSVFTAT